MTDNNTASTPHVDAFLNKYLSKGKRILTQGEYDELLRNGYKPDPKSPITVADPELHPEFPSQAEYLELINKHKADLEPIFKAHPEISLSILRDTNGGRNGICIVFPDRETRLAADTSDIPASFGNCRVCIANVEETPPKLQRLLDLFNDLSSGTEIGKIINAHPGARIESRYDRENDSPYLLVRLPKRRFFHRKNDASDIPATIGADKFPVKVVYFLRPPRS